MSRPNTDIVTVPLTGYKQVFRGKQAKQDEAKRLNKDITQMSTTQIIGKLYDRHATGFWMTWAIIATSVGVLSAVI